MGALTRRGGSGTARIAAVCALVALAAITAILILSHSDSAPAIAVKAPVEVAANVDPGFVQFGDRVTARVAVTVDARLVRASTVRVTYDLAPLTQLGPAQTLRSTQAGVELVTVAVPVACLTAPCVANSGEARVSLPPARVSVQTQRGETVRAEGHWPKLLVQGRVTSSDLAPSSPPFEADTTPPAPTYRVAPATLAALLEVFAMLCALAAIALVGWQVHHRSRRLRPRPGELERALRLTREAESRPSADRRSALALLSRVLDGDRRSGAARKLAWSEPTPEPEALEDLVSEIEQAPE